MSQSPKKILNSIRPSKIIYPILIGLGVIAYLIYDEVNVDKLRIKLTEQAELEDWYEYDISENRETVYINITDSTMQKQDTIRIEANYWISDSPIASFHSDTLTLLRGSNYPLDNPRLREVAFEANTLEFSFHAPLKNVFSGIRINWATYLFFLAALSMMVVRDIGYIIRIRVLTEGELTWWQSIRIIFLWEFTSALSPSAIGGSGVAIFLFNKEGLSIGKSTAMVMATVFLDEVYFLLFVPLVLLIVSPSDLFLIGAAKSNESLSFTNEFFYFALVGYLAILVFTLFLAYGLFINPRGMKWALLKIFRLPILRRWREGARQTGTDLVLSSRELRTKSFGFWFNAFFATVMSWTARYWIVNLLLISFFTINDHFLIFARQLVMWIMMIVSPTPGGSGFSEYVFTAFLGEFIPVGMSTTMALLWRLVTYYPYLLIGVILLPRWIRRKFGTKKTA